MRSMIVSKGNRAVLEVELATTGGNREQIAAAALAMHGLRPNQIPVVFLTPSTECDR